MQGTHESCVEGEARRGKGLGVGRVWSMGFDKGANGQG